MAQSQKHRFWQRHIEGWQRSGLSQAVYCETHNLSLSSFGYWRKRCAVSSAPVPVVIPVVREAALSGVQLRSPGGWQVALPSTLDVNAVRVLLAALP